MTRAEALADLIARVEAGDRSGAVVPAGPAMPDLRSTNDVLLAFDGSLDAVARLEAPLRERGWVTAIYAPGPSSSPANWWVEAAHGRGILAQGGAPAEARARLLAVLRALHHEASQ